MKQRFKKLLAFALSASMCLPMLPAETVRAADPGVTFTEAEQVFVNDYGQNRSTKINDNWKFYLGRLSGASSKDMNDADWDNVDLPHDFSITQDFTASGEAESGFLPGGTGWYRKHLTLSESLGKKRVLLNFDGVYSHATVYVNGEKVGEHHYGYTPFAFDITDYVVCDGATENIIAVEAVNNVPSSRWYSGSGIYRDVNLIVTDPAHIAYNGVAVTTPNLKSSNGADGTVNTAVEVQNDGDATVNVTVRNSVYEKGGKAPVSSSEKSEALPAGNAKTIQTSSKVDAPKLWSTDEPNLYYVKTEILQGNTVLDSYDTEFGFKWFEFLDNKGFRLNGESLKINGVCMHHDQGALGAAAYHDAIYRQMQIMKDMGANTIRITHNPGAEVLVDICNELGLLVIEEFFDGWEWPKNGNSNDFSTHFTKNMEEGNQVIGGSTSMTWAEFVLKSTVKRDRNDASIILWSLGNEIDENSGGGPWNVNADNLIRWTEEVDQTHPVTSGSNRRSLSSEGDTGVPIVNQKIFEAGGVPGYNYGDIGSMNAMHERYPVMLWSETASAVNSRGIYTTQNSQADADGKHHLTSYDTSSVGWGKTAHASMYPTLTTDWIAGECVWTGFDYIGEPTPWNGTGTGDGGRGAVPNSSYFGIVETSGFPKDNYYLYRSQWNQSEGANTLHLVTAWDSDNMMETNGKTPVWVYSNAKKVELYLNDKLIGTATRKPVSETTTAEGHVHYEYTTESNDGSCSTSSGTGDQSLYSVFNVAYQEGTISAKAYDANGTEITDTCEGKRSVSTPGAPAKLSVSQDKTELLADGSSLAYISVDVTDANGNFDTTATNDIVFNVTGNGEILGVDNGDQATVHKFQQASVMTSKTSAHINAYAGKALAIVRSTTKDGGFKVSVSSNGLTGGEASVSTTLPEGQSKNRIESYRMAKHCYAPVGTKTLPLPEKISVTRADGTTQDLAAAWSAYDDVRLKSSGTFTINGTIGSGAEQIGIALNVHMYGNVTGAKNVSAYTGQNIMPTLPTSLMTYLADGTDFEEFPVTWDMAGIKASDFATVNGIKLIKGTVSAPIIGKTFPVTASVRVAESVPGERSNIAPVASDLKQNCDPASDQLESVIDGSRYSDPNGSSGRWTNWNNTVPETPAITLAWDTVHAVDEVHLYYYTDKNVKKPGNITIELSSDGVNFNKMEYAEPETIPAVTEGEKKASEGEIFRLNEITTPIAVRIKLEPAEGSSYVGLTEIEVMSTQYDYIVNSSADLSGISVGGQAVAGFSADKTDYTVSSLGTVSAENNAKNVAVTVLPEYKGLVTIITASEDGGATKKYTVSRQATATETNEFKQSLTEAQNFYSGKYTAESFQLFQQTAKELESASLTNISAKELNDLIRRLEEAIKALELSATPSKPPVTPPINPPATPTLTKGQTATVSGNTYKVLDPAKKTVQLTKGNKKKKGKLTIGTVTINTIKCTVTSISANAFKNATKLTSVSIGDNVTSIGKNAFANCKGITSVTIGKKVKTIDASAFFNCKKLNKVTFKGTAVKTIKAKAFKGTKKNITVSVPKKLKKNKSFKKKLKNAGMNKNLKIK